jgi:hypothetical protein
MSEVRLGYARRLASSRKMEALNRQSWEERPFPKARKVAARKSSYLANNPKLRQLREERFTEIERENRILLEKICSIMKTPAKVFLPNQKPSNSKRKPKSRVYNHSRLSMCENDEQFSERQSNSSFSNAHFPMLRQSQQLVATGNKAINGRDFFVRVYDLGSNVRILVEDKTDAYVLMLGKSDAVEVMQGHNWSILVDSIHMEENSLVLYKTVL